MSRPEIPCLLVRRLVIEQTKISEQTTASAGKRLVAIDLAGGDLAGGDKVLNYKNPQPIARLRVLFSR